MCTWEDRWKNFILCFRLIFILQMLIAVDKHDDMNALFKLLFFKYR